MRERPHDDMLRAAMRSDARLTAMFSIIGAPAAVEMIGLAGFDCVIVDMEHGPIDVRDLPTLIMAAERRGAHAIVRVPDTRPQVIGAALDAGASGVLVPLIDSADAARAAVAAARFAPEGNRGVNPWVRAAEFGRDAGWLGRANDGAAVMVMIEGVGGIAALDDILAVPGLDAVFLGPVDMSQSMGLPGQPEHPQVIAAIEDAVARARDRGVGVAVFAPDAKAAARWFARGVSFVAISEDTITLLSALTTLHRDATG